MHLSLALLAKVLHSNDIAKCLLNVCAPGLQRQMKPRCCLVMDQRVGRRGCRRTSYWLLQADVKTLQKHAWKILFSLAERESRTKQKWHPKPRWTGRHLSLIFVFHPIGKCDVLSNELNIFWVFFIYTAYSSWILQEFLFLESPHW